MSTLMMQVVQRLEALPEDRQAIVAPLLLEELNADANWDSALANSQDLLVLMASEALADHEQGRTITGGFGIE